MSLTLELSKDVEAALASQAEAAHMSAEQYVAEILERALENRRRFASEQLERHLDVMAECVVPGTTSEQMDEAIDAALAAVRPRRTWQR